MEDSPRVHRVKGIGRDSLFVSKEAHRLSSSGEICAISAHQKAARSLLLMEFMQACRYLEVPRCCAHNFPHPIRGV